METTTIDALELFNRTVDTRDRQCPWCADGVLSLTEATTVETYVARGSTVVGQPLPTRERELLAAACNACEFMVEVRL